MYWIFLFLRLNIMFWLFFWYRIVWISTFLLTEVWWMGYLTVSQLHPLFIFNIVTNTLQNPRSKRELFLFMDVHDRMFTQLTILIAFPYCSPKFLFLLCAFGRVESDWIPRIDAAIVIRGRLLLLSGHNNSLYPVFPAGQFLTGTRHFLYRLRLQLLKKVDFKVFKNIF